MLKAHRPLIDRHLSVTDSDTESDDMKDTYNGPKLIKKGECSFVKSQAQADEIARQANKYQENMKDLMIPEFNESINVEYKTWEELSKILQKFYKQPLHYLTILMLKQWDKQRVGSTNECKPLDEVVGLLQAEPTIWYIESVHRLTTSPDHITKLWVCDPKYRKFANVPNAS